MTATCGACAEPITDAGYLCHGCSRRLAFTLRDIPDLARELNVTITRRAKITYRSGPARPIIDPDTVGVTMPWNEGASNALSDLEASIRGWARNLAEDEGGAANVETGTWVQYLASHINRVRLRDWAPDMFAEVTDAVARARRTIDAPPDLEFLGLCTGEGLAKALGQHCGAELWGHRDTDTVRCRTCHATHDTHEIKARAFAEHAHLKATAPQLAGLLGIKAARVYKWVQRGLLAPVGVEPRTGVDLYRLGDVSAVLERMERKVPKGVLRPKGQKGAK